MMMTMTMMMIMMIISEVLKVMVKVTTVFTIMLKIFPSHSISLYNYCDRVIFINVISKVPEMVNRMTGVDVTNVRTIHEKYL